MFDKEEEIGVVRPNGNGNGIGNGNGTNVMESSADATPYPASSSSRPTLGPVMAVRSYGENSSIMTWR